jgi:hypothetical protein
MMMMMMYVCVYVCMYVCIYIYIYKAWRLFMIIINIKCYCDIQTKSCEQLLVALTGSYNAFKYFPFPSL